VVCCARYVKPGISINLGCAAVTYFQALHLNASQWRNVLRRPPAPAARFFGNMIELRRWRRNAIRLGHRPFLSKSHLRRSRGARASLLLAALPLRAEPGVSSLTAVVAAQTLTSFAGVMKAALFAAGARRQHRKRRDRGMLFRAKRRNGKR